MNKDQSSKDPVIPSDSADHKIASKANATEEEPMAGQPAGSVSRGIEILIKKAAVDEDFKLQLLECRADAAKSIGLQLQPAEVMMMAAVPASQLEAIIAQTTVPQEHRRAFLGYVATAMLATLGLSMSGCDRTPSRGSRPEPIAPGGCRPWSESKPVEEPPPPAEPSSKLDAEKTAEIEKRVCAIVASQMGVEPGILSRSTSFEKDLHVDSLDTVELVMEIEEQFNISIPDDVAVNIRTIGEAVDVIAKEKAQKSADPPEATPSKPAKDVITRGIRADRP